MVHDDTIINPSIAEWSDHYEEIFEIFEREYEVAPENFNLKQFYNVSPAEDNFFIIREKLKWIMVDSWLHHFQGKEFVEMANDAFHEDEEGSMPAESREMYIYDTMDTFVLSKYTPLLARQGKEWLAYALGKDHPLFESLLEMGEKKSGFFFYQGKEGDDLLFEHIATGTELKVTSRSIHVPPGTEPGKSISFVGFVRWKGEWWFSGAQLNWGYDEKLIREEKESEKSRMLFGKDPDERRKENRQLYPSFLKFNHGKPLAFVESQEAANRVIHDFVEYHNTSRKRFSLKDQNQPKLPEPDPVQGEQIPGMIFYDPDAGINLAFGFNNLIPDKRNNSYVKGAEDEDGNEAMRMLESPYISGNWMHYLVAHYDFPGLEFPGLSGRELLMNNLDFMLRLWKRKGYHSK